MNIISEDNPEGVIGIVRDAAPTHYSFKMNSFSLLSKYAIERYKSPKFEAGGYKWKLILYPNGNKQQNGKDHISLYLMISGRKSLPTGWQVNAAFRLFLFDQIHDTYLALGDIGGRVRRFHDVKVEWGFTKLIPLTTFNDPSCGYLVDDTCVLGAEVFVCKTTCIGQCLSMLKNQSAVIYSWTIES